MWTAALLLASSIVGQAAEVNVPKGVQAEFQFLVAHWDYTGESYLGAAKGTITTTWVPGKHAILLDMTWADPNHTSKGTEIMGWDAADNRITTMEFWDDGSFHCGSYIIKSPGVWQSDDWHGADKTGKRVTGRAILERQGPDKLVWRTENLKIGGERASDTNITYVKK